MFSEFNAVIPDLVFVRNERWNDIVANDRFVAAPDLVIEIVSPGTENRNRGLKAKRKLYAKYGVEEYWVVDRENRVLMIFRLQDQTLRETARLPETGEMTSPLLPGFRLNVGSIFVWP